MTPPTAKPLAPTDAPAALHAAIARRRGGPSGVRVVSSRSADGTDAAAAAPCRQRAAVSSTTEPATAASILGSAVTTTVTPSTSTNCTEHNAVIARPVFRPRPLVAMLQPYHGFLV